MKKMWKKLSAVLLAAVMVLAMAVPAMAAEKTITGTPSAADKGTVTISGLAEGDTVSFYRIVEPSYDGDKGFTGYHSVLKDDAGNEYPLFDEDDKPIYPDEKQVTELAKDTSALTKKYEKVAAVQDGESWKVAQELEVGEWLAVVTSGDTDTVYNPMVVSVYYTGEGGRTITTADLSVGTDTKYTISTTDGFVKKSTTENKKTITGNTDDDVQTADAGKHGDDLGVGDTIVFRIDSHIPAYSSEYNTVEFTVNDTMDEGLDFDKGTVKVLVGGEEVTAGDSTFKLKEEGHGFEVAFVSDYLKGLAMLSDTERAVVVTYSATLNENAATNFSDNTNTSTITYTHNPDGSTKTITDETHQYTFEIDGKIDGESTEIKRYGHELIKVNEGGADPEQKWVLDEEVETTVKNGLAGAEFELVQTKNNKGDELSADEQKKHTYRAVTDKNGYFVSGEDSEDNPVSGFKGLDAGTYTLRETKAPNGYSLDSTVHTVEISATYNEDGTLASYTILIDESKTTYEKTYKSETVEHETVTTPADATTYIKNTKMNELPSTGGIGTYLFTFIGVVCMVLGAWAYRRNKKSVSF